MARCSWALILLVCCLINPVGFAEEITSDSLGRSIYETGIGRDGRSIRARLHGSITLSGAAISCINCHGKDGRGGGEAFIRVPDIRWFHLSKPFAARRTGVAESAYDRTSFARALRLGISSSGRKLDPAMPRTDLADDEIDSLIDYLAALDESPPQDSSPPAILGLLPKSGLNPLADTLSKKLTNCPPVNGNQPVSAIDILYFDNPENAIQQLKARLTQNPNALILAPFLMGWESRYVEAMQHEQAFTILPVTQIDPLDGNRWFFHFPGLKAQILALLRSAWRDGYTRLRIEYQAGNVLSANLFDFARQMADEIGFITHETSQSSIAAQQPSAHLWLRPVDREEIDSQHGQNELMLVPGLFFTQSPPGTAHGQHKFSRWRLAYPYALQQRKSAEWITPAEAWATAACEFLARVGEGSIDRHNLANSSLESRPFATSPTLEQSASQVYLHEFAKETQF